jgi:hypothetical protein
MGNVIILWLFGLVGMVFAVMMMIAGFGLITSGGNTSALEAAKSKFVNAIIGLVIMMSAWLLVDTLMKRLLVGGSLETVSTGWGPWNQLQCTLQTVTLEGRPGVPTAPPMGSPGRLTYLEASNQLTAAGIIVTSSGNCFDVQCVFSLQTCILNSTHAKNSRFGAFWDFLLFLSSFSAILWGT